MPVDDAALAGTYEDRRTGNIRWLASQAKVLRGANQDKVIRDRERRSIYRKKYGF